MPSYPPDFLKMPIVHSQDRSNWINAKGPFDRLIEQFLGANPSAAFFNVFPKAGGTNPLADFLRGSQGRLYSSYLGQLPNRPNLMIQDFLREQDLEGEFRNLAPSQRGERPGAFAPPIRFIPRRF